MISWLEALLGLILSGISRRYSPSLPHPLTQHVGSSRSFRLLDGGRVPGIYVPPRRVHGAHPPGHRELCAHQHGQEPPPALRGVQACGSPGAMAASALIQGT